MNVIPRPISWLPPYTTVGKRLLSTLCHLWRRATPQNKGSQLTDYNPSSPGCGQPLTRKETRFSGWLATQPHHQKAQNVWLLSIDAQRQQINLFQPCSGYQRCWQGQNARTLYRLLAINMPHIKSANHHKLNRQQLYQVWLYATQAAL